MCYVKYIIADNLYKQLLEGPEHQIGPDGKVTSTIKNEEIARLRLHEAQAESVIAPTITQLRELVDGVLDRAEVIGDDLKSAIGDGEKFLAFDLTHVQTIRTSVETSRAGLEYVADAPNVVELPRVRK